MGVSGGAPMYRLAIAVDVPGQRRWRLQCQRRVECRAADGQNVLAEWQEMLTYYYIYGILYIYKYTRGC